MRTSSWTVHFLGLILLRPVTTDGTTFNITNRCSFTVWPAAVPGGGVQLHPGESWILNMPANSTTRGRVWARTACSFDDAGNGRCETGSCRGVLACMNNGHPPNTMAEFTLAYFNNADYFRISFVDGFNVPMDFLPVPTNRVYACNRGPRCTADITSQCPSELKAPGGCNSACTVFKQDEYCCTGNTSKHCEPTTYSVFFVHMCPDAYSYSMDHTMNIFTCPTGTNYQVVFCPPNDISDTTPAPTTGPTRINDLLIKRSKVFGVVLGSISSSIVLVIFVTFFVCKLRKQRHHEVHEVDEEFKELPGMPIRFTFQQLQEATEQFRYKLGEGGFGSVFKGKYGEEIIAVKRSERSGQGKKEFLAEVQAIGSIHHIHLVRLIGFCVEKSHRILVYEYMPKGSLDRWIDSSHDNNAPSLDWQTRRKIITHIAKGLSYLHEECVKRIAHLDIKPQNILLDETFNAKLSDFGLCKLIDQDTSQVITRMRGTPGYLAPEWLTTQITEKADIYSFGVVVMEIISNRRNIDTSRSEESIHLITLLEEKVKSDELADLIDKHNTDMQVHTQEVIEMMKLAMWCLQIDPKRRPRMSEVIKVLEGYMNVESKINLNFVATNQTMFGAVAENTGSSDPPQASDLSGPR